MAQTITVAAITAKPKQRKWDAEEEDGPMRNSDRIRCNNPRIIRTGTAGPANLETKCLLDKVRIGNAGPALANWIALVRPFPGVPASNAQFDMWTIRWYRKMRNVCSSKIECNPAIGASELEIPCVAIATWLGTIPGDQNIVESVVGKKVKSGNGACRDQRRNREHRNDSPAEI